VRRIVAARKRDRYPKSANDVRRSYCRSKNREEVGRNVRRIEAAREESARARARRGRKFEEDPMIEVADR
jgi:hypothetical protein